MSKSIHIFLHAAVKNASSSLFIMSNAASFWLHEKYTKLSRQLLVKKQQKSFRWVKQSHKDSPVCVSTQIWISVFPSLLFFFKKKSHDLLQVMQPATTHQCRSQYGLAAEFRSACLWSTWGLAHSHTFSSNASVIPLHPAMWLFQQSLLAFL